eukprot:1828670-Lingulodinium_polyedra.AAC.1
MGARRGVEALRGPKVLATLAAKVQRTWEEGFEGTFNAEDLPELPAEGLGGPAHQAADGRGTAAYWRAAASVAWRPA